MSNVKANFSAVKSQADITDYYSYLVVNWFTTQINFLHVNSNSDATSGGNKILLPLVLNGTVLHRVIFML
jgi:hypothetical protein